MKRTNSYITTLDHYNASHFYVYKELREIVMLFNRTEATNFRLMRRGRLGRNSAYASKYAGRRDNFCVHVDDAARFDIYLYHREFRDERIIKLNETLKSWARGYSL